MNATVDEIQKDLANDVASGKQLLAKVTALEALTDSVVKQLDAIIAAGTVTPKQLNALRDGLVSAKAQADQASASIDTTIAADTPATTPTPTTPPAPASTP